MEYQSQAGVLPHFRFPAPRLNHCQSEEQGRSEDQKPPQRQPDPPDVDVRLHCIHLAGHGHGTDAADVIGHGSGHAIHQFVKAAHLIEHCDDVENGTVIRYLSGLVRKALAGIRSMSKMTKLRKRLKRLEYKNIAIP